MKSKAYLAGSSI